MSTFAVVRRNGKVLIGTPKRHANWPSKWLFSWAVYSKEELEEEYLAKRIPSTYLLEGEHPEHAIQRIMSEQLQMPHYSTGGPRVFSYNSPSSRYPGNSHWDLAFVYDVNTHDPVKKLGWWKELDFVESAKLHEDDFGWNSDFVVDLGLTGPEPVSRLRRP
jgi:hypothetical protein